MNPSLEQPKPMNKRLLILVVSIAVLLLAVVFVIYRFAAKRVPPEIANTILVPYPAAPDFTPSEVYSVTVNGQALDVQADMDVDGSGSRHFVHFAFAGVAKIEVRTTADIKQFILSPASLNISPTVSGQNLAFTLTVPRKLILWDVNGSKDKLFILADPLEQNPPRLGESGITNLLDFGADSTGKADSQPALQSAIDEASSKKGTVYIPDGLYRISGPIQMKDNVTLYLEGGAVLRGHPQRDWLLFDFSGAHHAAITGRGTLDSAGAKRVSLGGLGMSDITLEGFVLMRQHEGYHTWLQYADRLTIRNVKLVGGVSASGNDGLDFDVSQHVTVDDVFVYSGDDCLSPKIYGEKTPEWQRDVVDVNVTHMVCWNNGSGAGIKTFEAYGGKVLRQMTFEDIDIVHAATDAGIAFYAVGGGGLEQVWVKNARVEKLADRKHEGHRPLAISSVDWNPWGSTDPAFIRDITFQNVYFQDNGSYPSEIRGRDAQHLTENITFDHLVENGQLMTEARNYFAVMFHLKNIVFSDTPRPEISVRPENLFVARGQAARFIVSRNGEVSQPLKVSYSLGGNSARVDVILAAGEDSTLIEIPTSADTAFVMLELKNTPHCLDYLLTGDWRAVVVATQP